MDIAQPKLTDQNVFEYIKDRDHVSFAELMREFGDAAKGQIEMQIPDHNLVLWSGVSELFVDVIKRLLKSEEIFYEPSTHLVYLIDGGFLKYPIARRPPKGGYKKTHWVPIVFRSKDKKPKEKKKHGSNSKDQD